MKEEKAGRVFDLLVRKIYEAAKQRHSVYCDYPCFDEEDVRQYLGHIFLGDLNVDYDGTIVWTNWTQFGNASWEHFVDAVNNAMNDILDVLEGKHIISRLQEIAMSFNSDDVDSAYEMVEEIERLIQDLKRMGRQMTPTLVCAYCNTEIEVDDLNDIVECPNCGAIVSKETAGKVIE